MGLLPRIIVPSVESNPFKYATLKVRYLNSIKNTNFIVDDAI